MKELIVLFAVAAVFVFGFFIMKRLDEFLDNRCVEKDYTENGLVLAFDNPLIISSLMPLFEKFQKANPECRFHFLYGNAEDIFENMDHTRVDFGFIKYTSLEKEDGYSILIISPNQNSIFCKNIECLIEPLNSGQIQIAIIWKKDLNSTFAKCFSDWLLSNQDAIKESFAE